MEVMVSNQSTRVLRTALIIGVFTTLFGILTALVNVFLIPYSLLWQTLIFIGTFTIYILFYSSGDEQLQREHDKQIHASRTLYATLYNQSPVPYLTLDEKGQVTTCNQAALRLLDTDTETIFGKTIIDRLQSPDDNAVSIAMGKLEANVSFFDTEFEIATFADQKRWVSMSMFVNETFNQRLVSLVDMTHRKQVDMAKSEFVALATHQLRTPIAAIRWNVELLERTMRETSSDKQKNYLEKITRNVSRMLALINDFLSVSKLETGTFATTIETINVREYLTTIIDEYQQAVTEKQINLVPTFEPADLMINTDTRLFHIITSNLLSNAVKYVQNNATIQFGYVATASTIVITVADNGIGIPAEQLERLFTKFFRASNAQLHRAEGTGLGLYIVKESVEILGGTIQVNSVENEGTTFVITLPLA
ncbi:PAS domain-containing sensor histidine kinase [Patescibacteria group bacterium]|nr:PAS domain-containing sensor histidine kinase [Patescibacteria group bacterium]